MREVIENGIQVHSFLHPERFPEVGFGLHQQRFTLGEEADSTRPLLIVTEFPPNAVLPRHYHGDVFMDAVVRGSSIIDGETHPAGTVRWFPAKAMYGPVIAGPEGCTLLEFYVSQPGFQTTLDEEALTDEMRAELVKLRNRTPAG